MRVYIYTHAKGQIITYGHVAAKCVYTIYQYILIFKYIYIYMHTKGHMGMPRLGWVHVQAYIYIYIYIYIHVRIRQIWNEADMSPLYPATVSLLLFDFT